MADALVTVADLQARYGETLDAGQQALVTGAIEDLSDDARHYGDPTWDSETAPRQIKNLVLRAVVRYMRNPDGFTTSRAGDETVSWSDYDTTLGQAIFTKVEIEQIQSIAGRSPAIISVPVAAYGPPRQAPRYVDGFKKDVCSTTVYAPTDSGKPFPVYSGDDEVF